MEFSPEEMQDAFALIQERYYHRNFGTMTKTDFETLLFRIYLNHLLVTNAPFDDYTMSKALGISQSKIRNLKARNELQYPRQSEHWKEHFAALVPNAVYDEQSRTVKMQIPEVTDMTELRYYLECNNWFDEYQLNPKLFQCRADFFLELCRSLGELLTPDKNAETKLKEIQKLLDEKSERSGIQKILDGAVEDGLKELAINGSKELITEVLKLLPFGGVAATAINAFVRVLEK